MLILKNWDLRFRLKYPDNWQVLKLKEVAKVKGGKRLPKGEPFSEIKTNHPYLRVTDFKNNMIDDSNIKFVSEEIFKKIKNHTISSDDVYISIAGTIGLVGLIPKALDGSNLTENAAKIIILKNVIKEYLSILLNSEIIQNQIKSYLGTTSQPKLALFRIEKLELPLPSLKEQKQIASILSNVDALIESTQGMIEKTERLKKGLMQKLLTRGIGHTKFKKVDLFDKEIEIPQEWEVKMLKSCCEIRKEKNIKSNLYIGLEHMGQGTNTLVSVGVTKQFTSTKNVFKKGDVLYGKLRPLLNKVWLSSEDGFCSTDVLPIKTKKNLYNKILENILSSRHFVIYADSLSAGTKMPRINWSDIGKYEFLLPPLLEQKYIASILSGIDAYIQKNQEYKERLEILKKGLMQKLLTGKIRVKIQ